MGLVRDPWPVRRFSWLAFMLARKRQAWGAPLGAGGICTDAERGHVRRAALRARGRQKSQAVESP